MPLNPSNPCQEPTCPYASPVGVVEERCVLMGFLMVPMDPQGPHASLVGVVGERSVLMVSRWFLGTQWVIGNISCLGYSSQKCLKTPQSPVRNLPVLMAPQLELWRTGVS